MSALIVCFLVAINSSSISAYGTCDDTYHIEKFTYATSDSLRESKYIFNIFAHLNEQETTHFVSGMCANGMKVELPDSCFKIHAPQTWQHDQGLLGVDIYERKFSEKWSSVMNGESQFHFDSFFDFNIAFFVHSLDEYIEKWTAFNEETSDEQIEYFGIEWIYNLGDVDLKISSADYEQNKFYSVLVHSPSSAAIFEFTYLPQAVEQKL